MRALEKKANEKLSFSELRCNLRAFYPFWLSCPLFVRNVRAQQTGTSTMGCTNTSPLGNAYTKIFNPN